MPRPPKPRPVPTEDDPTYQDWPRTEYRHLIATLPTLPRGWMRGQASR